MSSTRIKRKTKSKRLVYTDQVLKRKPVRERGQDLREFPTYTIPEAAAFLGIPIRTLRHWFSGRDPLLKPSGKVEGQPLLSFADLADAYALHLLRTFHRLPMQTLRRSLEKLPKHTKTRRPLVSENLRVFEQDLTWKHTKGKFAGATVSLSKDQLIIPHVADIFSHRVLRDSSGRITALFPWKNLPQSADNAPKPVQINPEIMSGRLTVVGTRVPVSTLAAHQRRGDSIESIAADYRIPIERVERALQHFAKTA